LDDDLVEFATKLGFSEENLRIVVEKLGSNAGQVGEFRVFSLKKTCLFQPLLKGGEKSIRILEEFDYGLLS